jgi:integrase
MFSWLRLEDPHMRVPTSKEPMMKRGSIRQRGTNSWELRVYRGVDPDTGRQRYEYRTVRGSRRCAERELKAFVAEVDNALVHAGTVEELLERWFAAASPGWSPTTAAHTRSIIDCHLAPHLGHLPVAKVTTADIDALYGHLLAYGGPGGDGLQPATVRRIHSVLHRAMVQAHRWGWIWINPASEANPPRVRRPEITLPTPQQVMTLLDTVGEDSPALCCFLRMAATTGARRGELLALRWGAVDLERGSVAFTRALLVGPAGPVLSSTKTDRAHSTDLDTETLRLLQEHRAREELRACASGCELGPDAFVFSHDVDGGRPWTPNWTTKQFVAAQRAAGLAEFRLHDLRHFMATHMLAQAVPLAVVSRRLNHARVSTTVNCYTHSMPAWDRAAAEVLAGLLNRGRGRVQQMTT